MKGEIWILQDDNSPHMKVWALLIYGNVAKVMYGGPAGSSGRSISSHDPKKAMSALRVKKRKYPKEWHRWIDVPDLPTLEGTMDKVCREVYDTFLKRGGFGDLINGLLDGWEDKLQSGIVNSAACKGLTDLLQSIPPTLPWAF